MRLTPFSRQCSTLFSVAPFRRRSVPDGGDCSPAYTVGDELPEAAIPPGTLGVPACLRNHADLCVLN